MPQGCGLGEHGLRETGRLDTIQTGVPNDFFLWIIYSERQILPRISIA